MSAFQCFNSFFLFPLLLPPQSRTCNIHRLNKTTPDWLVVFFFFFFQTLLLIKSIARFRRVWKINGPLISRWLVEMEGYRRFVLARDAPARYPFVSSRCPSTVRYSRYCPCCVDYSFYMYACLATRLVRFTLMSKAPVRQKKRYDDEWTKRDESSSQKGNIYI